MAEKDCEIEVDFISLAMLDVVELQMNIVIYYNQYRSNYRVVEMNQ